MAKKKPGPPKGVRFGGKPKGFKAPHTLEKEAAREAVRTMVIDALQPMVEAQITNAKGLKYLVVRDKKTGKFKRVPEQAAQTLKADEEIIEVWEKDPSVQAFAELLNRALDKPKEQEFTVEVKSTRELSDDELLTEAMTLLEKVKGTDGARVH